MVAIRPHDVILFFDPSKQELSLASVQYVENGQCLALTLEDEIVVIYNHCISEVIERDRLQTVLDNFPTEKLLCAKKFMMRAFSDKVWTFILDPPMSNRELDTRIVRDDAKWRAGQP